MITPFVSLYTGGISDIDYYQPLFATLLCLAEYVYCTSLTYNNMIMAAGHIKQTQWISVTEAIINIVLSLILVKWIGIIGVALGTLIAFAFNTSIRNFGKNNAEIIYSMIIYLLITGVSLSFLDIARIDVVPFLLLFLQTWKWELFILKIIFSQ